MKTILTIIFGLILVVSAGLAFLAFSKKTSKAKKVVACIFCAVAAIAFIIIPYGFYQVESGEAAVLKHFGQATSRVDAGLHWRFWVSDEPVIYDLKTQESKQTFEAYSQDAQPMTAELTIQFKAQPENLIKINEVYGSLEVLKERILGVANEKARVVLSRSSAMVIIENRANLSNEVQAEIESISDMYFVDITMIVIEDISFNEAFENAVEQKMIAEQQKLQAEYDKETAIIKAEQELEVAKKAAEAELAKAKASAQAQIEIANAEAEKIRIKSVEVAKMLGFTITEDGNIDMTGKSAEEIKLISDYLKYIEYLATWDGKLPEVVGGNTTSVVMPSPEGE
ncbi:MAG: prohibitin family protein [Bacilli bacterium]